MVWREQGAAFTPFFLLTEPSSIENFGNLQDAWDLARSLVVGYIDEEEPKRQENDDENIVDEGNDTDGFDSDREDDRGRLLTGERGSTSARKQDGASSVHSGSTEAASSSSYVGSQRGSTSSKQSAG